MRFACKAALTVATALPATAALAMSGPAAALAIDSSGGTAGPVAVVATRGTGGAEYRMAPPARRVVGKPAVHKRTQPRRHTRKPAPRKPAPAPTPTPPAPEVTETPVFPVRGPHSFGDAANRFGAGRAGHVHQGQDVLADEGRQVVAPLAGTILTTGFQASAAGWYVVEHTTTAFDFFFAHCQAGSLAVSAGQAVRAGQALCKVGQTGDATGPHLHLEMWVGGWQAPGGRPVDPLPYLEAWDR